MDQVSDRLARHRDALRGQDFGQFRAGQRAALVQDVVQNAGCPGADERVQAKLLEAPLGVRQVQRAEVLQQPAQVRRRHEVQRAAQDPGEHDRVRILAGVADVRRAQAGTARPQGERRGGQFLGLDAQQAAGQRRDGGRGLGRGGDQTLGAQPDPAAVGGERGGWAS